MRLYVSRFLRTQTMTELRFIRHSRDLGEALALTRHSKKVKFIVFFHDYRPRNLLSVYKQKGFTRLFWTSKKRLSVPHTYPVARVRYLECLFLFFLNRYVGFEIVDQFINFACLRFCCRCFTTIKCCSTQCCNPAL